MPTRRSSLEVVLFGAPGPSLSRSRHVWIPASEIAGATPRHHPSLPGWSAVWWAGVARHKRRSTEEISVEASAVGNDVARLSGFQTALHGDEPLWRRINAQARAKQ